MNFAKLDRFMEALPARGMPGCELAVSYMGKQVYRKRVGFSDAAGTRPTSENDLYWVFSVSKITTCVSAMRLVEEGKLRLDDPVSKYLPAYAHLTVLQPDGSVRPAQNVMTVEHLFLMTAGLDYDFSHAAFTRARSIPNVSTQEIANALAMSALRFEPGTRYLYSLCHDVLAAVVEVAAGERFCDYVQRTVFTPLGMNDSSYHPSPEAKARIADMYHHIHGLYQAEPTESTTRYNFSDRYDSGGAGICSSVTDQLRLMTVLANGGSTEDGYSLLKPETIAMMQVNRLPLEARPSFNPTRLFGYGWGLCGRVHDDPEISMARSSKGEFGWDGAAGAFALIDPASRVALYFSTHTLGNHYCSRVVHPTVRDLTYEALNINV